MATLSPTRFFALHAGVLPGLLVGFLVLHLAMFQARNYADSGLSQWYSGRADALGQVAYPVFGLVVYVGIIP